MAADPDDFSHLDRAGEATARLVTQSRTVVWVAVAAALALSWGLLAVIASTQPVDGLSAGPGGGLLPALPLSLPTPLSNLVSLCLTPTAASASPGARFAALALMWTLTSVAMMLPSAAPMLRTYCEIADTAAAKGEPAVHPLVLVAGYLTVWLAAALGFAAVTMAVGAFGGPASLGVGAVMLVLAGAYQFSPLKEACLKKCRRPFAILFARWSPRPAKIFRLGVEQGLWCLGCCWALMLVMLAVGTMNLFWMALIALFATVEKQAGNRVPTFVAGAILLVWGAALLVSSL
jgi:predicted metal-binding membrane protein